MPVIFHRLVQQDLNTILNYYEDEASSALADHFFAEVELIVSQVSKHPERFHPISHELRRANFPNFPYHFLFRVTETSTRILVLRHHRRHPEFGLSR